MVDDSSDINAGSDTDLDLPDPVSFLQPLASDASPTKAAETTETSKPERRKALPVTTYSPKRTPRSSRRSDNRSVPSSPTTKKQKKQFTAIAENHVVSTGERHIREGTVRTSDGGSRTRRLSRESKRKQEGKETVVEGRVEKKRTKDRLATGRSEGSGDDQAVRIVIQTTGLTGTQLKRVQSAAATVSAQGFASSSGGGKAKYAVSVHSDTSVLHNACKAKTNNLSNPAESGALWSSPKSQRWCTHLVAPVDKQRRAARTFKYVAGLVCGARAVAPEWLVECAKARKLLPETGFLIHGDTAMPECALADEGLPPLRSVGELLSGYQVHLWNGSRSPLSSNTHTLEDLRALVTVAGAEVVDELVAPAGADETSSQSYDGEEEPGSDDGRRMAKSPRLRNKSTGARTPDRNMAADLIRSLPGKYRRMFELPLTKDKPLFVLVDLDDLYPVNEFLSLQSIAQITKATVPCRTTSWLFDCISANKIIHQKD
ncbi:hypothetical protein H4217_006361 [Coemansia sp. RSA 1939]|nr:hypothetical protein H4217_006361 [Coemansia sp. RSA 1939]KAJ2596528.1 hypothetical protein EV177_007917 [Coemansia sp. RSA 1804]KAJ2654497.1 hypothetical protein GGH99_007316 [Coemansia sp. RSA 1285]